ncbi:MAG TPA: BON domain-containing protein [Rhodanobacter sp.]
MYQSLIRNGLYAAALTLSFAAAPFGQVAAQQASAEMEQSTDNQTVPDKAADAWITTKVKSDFGTTAGIPATDISVTTHDGVVTLSGTVATSAEKANAERAARGIKGVKSVDSSRLVVRAASE